MKNDFIVFGRTIIYFIDEMYNILSGIIIDIQNSEDHTVSDIIGYYVRYKLPNTENQYETIYLLRDDIYFSKDDAETAQIQKLRQHIADIQEYQFNISMNEATSRITDVAYLFENNKNIFIDDSSSNTSIEYTANNGQAIFDFTANIKKYYKLVCKINNVIYSTPIVEATIYNELLDKQNIDIDECVPVELPTDYLSYITHVVNLPASVNSRTISFHLKKTGYTGDYIASTEVKTISSGISECSTNRYIPFGYQPNSLAYYIPNWTSGYDLYMKIVENDTTTWYKYNETVKILSNSVTFDYNDFEII